MRNSIAFVTLFAGFLGIAIHAADKPPADYQKAMKDLGAAVTDVDKTIAAEDYDRLDKLAVSAREAFTVVENYWTGKSSEAKDMARNGYKQAADLQVMAGQKSKDGAEFAAGEFKAVCEPCHAAHRELQPDGTFLIK